MGGTMWKAIRRGFLIAEIEVVVSGGRKIREATRQQQDYNATNTRHSCREPVCLRESGSARRKGLEGKRF